jgi:hypothetical protein
LYDGFLDMGLHTVLNNRLFSAYFLQSQFSSCIIKFTETIKSVSAIAHYLAGL